MKKLLLCSMLFVAMMFLGSNLFAQRYLDDVFSAVNKTTNVVYDSNRAVNIIPPNNPPIITQNLICDIYQPSGDSINKRPVIILLHTGSYLPTLVNQQTTGSKNDSNVVELANRFAKKGYVVVAMNYRLGWNPATTNQAAAAEQLIKATYRAIQDVRNCVRFMRKNASTYGVDTSMFIVGGQGTGGYVALGLAAVNKRAEIETNPKFLRGDLTPMVSVDTLGDWNGLGGNPFFNYGGEPDLSGNVHMVFNFGGAMGDSTWMDNATLPVVSLHCLKDPFAPYRTGNVIVPTTGITVIPSASGAGSVIPFANSLGINNKINSKTYTDPISVKAAALTGGVNNLYPFWTLTPEGSPWEWWDRAFVQSINFPSPGAGRIADSLSMLTNPFMSAARARAYCDTIVGFVTPRIVTQFDLVATTSLESLAPQSINYNVYPNPSNGLVNISSSQNIAAVRIIDITGKSVVETNQTKIDVSTLNKGIYFVEVTLENGAKSTKRLLVN